MVDVREDGGDIEPVRPGEYDLAQLLSAITPDNVHAEADFGPAMGGEAL